MASLFEPDPLRVYRGRDFQIYPGLRLRQPTLGEIEGGEADDAEGNERRFFQTVYTLMSTPTDLMAQLDMKGIRYEDITNYQLFMMLFPQMDQKDTKLLFGDKLNPKSFKPTPVANQPGRIVLSSQEDEITIDEVAYAAIVNYLSKVMNIKQTQFVKNGNEFTRMVRMEVAYEDMELAKNKPADSTLLNLISAMVNMEGFKYGWHDVWQMKIGAFMDSVRRIQTIISAKALLNGCYSGNIDTSKIDKNQLNYLKSPV